MTISLFPRSFAANATSACIAGAAVANTAAATPLKTLCQWPFPASEEGASKLHRNPFVRASCITAAAPAFRCQPLFGEGAKCRPWSQQADLLTALAEWERGLTNPRSAADPHGVRCAALKRIHLLAREGGLVASEAKSLVASLKYVVVNELNDAARLHAVLALSHIAGPDIIPFLRLHLQFDHQVILEVAIEHAISRIERRANIRPAPLRSEVENSRSGSQVMTLFRILMNEERIEILRNLRTRWLTGMLSQGDARLLEGWALTIVDHYGHITLYEGGEVWKRTAEGIEAQLPPCELYALTLLEEIGSKDSAANFKSWGGLIGPQNDLIVALVEDVGFTIRQRLAHTK